MNFSLPFHHGHLFKSAVVWQVEELPCVNAQKLGRFRWALGTSKLELSFIVSVLCVQCIYFLKYQGAFQRRERESTSSAVLSRFPPPPPRHSQSSAGYMYQPWELPSCSLVVMLRRKEIPYTTLEHLLIHPSLRLLSVEGFCSPSKGHMRTLALECTVVYIYIK